MKKLLTTSAILASAIALTACQSTPTSSNVTTQPVLQSDISTVGANSMLLGKMYLRPVDGGTQVFGELRGLNPGATVAVHIHEFGNCGNMGKAAGGHFNPMNQPHGHPSSPNSHAGDLPNVTADANGIARMNFLNKDISVATTGINSVYNRAFIVHGGVDDYTSQPSGDAGDRIACGIIEAM